MSDFTQPGSDGILPDDFVDWQWGVTYTLRPPSDPPLTAGREYAVTVSVRYLSSNTAAGLDYRRLYRHALRIAEARAAELKAVADAPRLHRRIIVHGWRSMDVGGKRLSTAFLTLGLLLPRDGESLPAGQPEPDDAALQSDGGATLVELQRQGPQLAPEVCVEFDHRDGTPSSESGIVTFAYGERVVVDDAFAFEPVIRRAEHRARFHRRLLTGHACPVDAPLDVLRREWFMVRDTSLATVHVYFREDRKY